MGQPLKLLLVAPSPELGGGQAMQASLLLRRLGEEQSLEVAFQDISPRLPRAFQLLKKIKYVRTLSSWPAYCAQLTKAVSRCDVVHVFSASYLSFVLAPTPAILVARAMRKPVIVNYHSGEAADHLTRWPSAVKMLDKADRITVPSAFLVRVFAQHGLQADRIDNAIDLAAFRFRQRPAPRAAFLVNRGLERHYGVAHVLRAFRLIQQRIPEASLTVAGDGPERSALERLARDLGLRKVAFIGRVAPPGMPVVYDDHDVWLNASEVDNVPLSILEAQASGLAVVTTNPGGIPDMVADYRSGMLVKVGDWNELANRALEVVGQPALFAQLTDRGLQESRRYSWSAVRDRWISLYSAVAEANRRAGSAGS